MDVQFILYVFLFVIIGVPLIGFAVRNLVRFGRYVYKSFPFLQKFFDDYFEHFAYGTIIVVVAGVVYVIGYMMGLV
jgi:hypothetical protein